jgi:hypothetical protein
MVMGMIGSRMNFVIARCEVKEVEEIKEVKEAKENTPTAQHQPMLWDFVLYFLYLLNFLYFLFQNGV